jgi:hypothetical protein
MKKVILGAAAITMLSISAPSSAQYYPNSNANQYGTSANGNVSARIGQLDARLEAGVRNGTITRNEARPIRQQIRQLRRLESQYAVNGISGQERAALQQQIRTIRQQLRTADGGNQAYAQWDAEDGYSAPYGQRVDMNRDGWDDRDLNRDGRLDSNEMARANSGYGYQQNYPQTYPQQQQSGIGGVISQILGVGGLQVGQRATGNLYGIPAQYQNQYRDGNGVYYRSDGRRIYQIDARTQTVVNVFGM